MDFDKLNSLFDLFINEMKSLNKNLDDIKGILSKIERRLRDQNDRSL